MSRARESEEVSMLETLRGDEARSGARGERRAGATSRITRRNGGAVYCFNKKVVDRKKECVVLNSVFYF